MTLKSWYDTAPKIVAWYVVGYLSLALIWNVAGDGDAPVWWVWVIVAACYVVGAVLAIRRLADKSDTRVVQ